MGSKKNIILNISTIILIVLSFLILDLGLRFITYDSFKFYSYLKFTPLGFSLSWISLIVGILFLISKKKRKIFYSILLIFYILITYSQYICFQNLGKFYGISDIFLVSEGAEYFKDAIKRTDLKIILVLIIPIILAIITIKLINITIDKKNDKQDKIFIICMTLIGLIGFRSAAILNMGEDENSYKASVNVIIVYEDFKDPTKTLQATGVFENLSRGIYMFAKKKIVDNTEEKLEKIDKYLESNNKQLVKNEYTGIFKDKNLIYILMESIDNILVTEEVMPTLTKLRKEGINFYNKYTPFFGGGQTINSEFATNTGLYSPNDVNIYDVENTYNTSLANKFKSIGYSTASIHFNNGFYYNREIFHTNLGYDNHYALADMELDNDEYNYKMDSNLIKSKKVYELISREDKFLTYITTYSAHMPYDMDEAKCQEIDYGLNDSQSELACAKNLARDTDEMIRLLIEKLEEEDKIDDTVLVFTSDHYMYGYTNINEERALHNEYLLQNTPFIIWAENLESEEITKVVDQADILPTILNMFDISYDPNLYVGEDIFSQNRKNYVYFNEDTYYDGFELYQLNDDGGDAKTYKEINETIKFNDNLIYTNYLKVEEKEELN